MRNLKQSHSAEKLRRGDPLGFLKLQFAANYQKKLERGQKTSKKVAQCRKSIERGDPLVSSRFVCNVRKGKNKEDPLH